MSTEQVLTLALAVFAAAEFAAIVVLAVVLARSRRQLSRLRSQISTPRTGGPRTAAGRAVKAVVDTAARVRTHGVGGLLMSSLEDLTRWATEDRAEIVRVAAADGTVTILFSDIEDSTALTEELGDQQWVRLLAAHDALVRECVKKHRGHVVKSQGDGFMVVFGEPEAAVRAALGIQRALATGSGRRLRRNPIKVRIGIHVGTAVSRDNDYFGRNVAMAARIAGQAQGGEILISDDLREALGEADDFVVASAGQVELKGLADVHALWTVDSAAA